MTSNRSGSRGLDSPHSECRSARMSVLLVAIAMVLALGMSSTPGASYATENPITIDTAQGPVDGGGTVTLSGHFAQYADAAGIYRYLLVDFIGLDGAEYIDSGIPVDSVDTPTDPLNPLLHGPSDTVVSQMGFVGHLDSFKVADSFDGIAAQDIVTGDYGMYDSRSGSFFGNASGKGAITGPTQSLSVTFGGAPCSDVTVTTTGAVTCTVPVSPLAGGVGPVDVVVTRGDQPVGTIPNGYAYVAEGSSADADATVSPDAESTESLEPTEPTATPPEAVSPVPSSEPATPSVEPTAQAEPSATVMQDATTAQVNGWLSVVTRGWINVPAGATYLDIIDGRSGAIEVTPRTVLPDGTVVTMTYTVDFIYTGDGGVSTGQVGVTDVVITDDSSGNQVCTFDVVHVNTPVGCMATQTFSEGGRA